MSATIRRVSRPRGSLTEEQALFIDDARSKKDYADSQYRRAVLTLLAEGCSFSEVSKATGLSTNTLQRWKREASA